MSDITVAICAYNSKKHIEETLIGIVNQTIQNLIYA
jgi:glycosyltransferase involved in cell wall biosynthesis